MTLITDVLASGVRIGAPIGAAALGETYSGRSGVINVGLEGMMLVGAFAGVLVSGATGSAWVGLLAAMGAGLLVALVHGLISITLRGNQVVSGIAINLVALGGTSFLLEELLRDRQDQTVPGFYSVPIPGLSRIPFLGEVLFRQSLVVYMLYILAAVSVVVLYRTHWGLKVQASGENPHAADAAGIGVNRIRYECVALAGLLAGMGGGMLALSQLRFFTHNLTAGRGFIAIAVVIFGNWRPGQVMLGAGLFGTVDALQLRLQAIGVPVPGEVMTMLPYLVTVLLLAGVARKARMPAYLTRVFVRGEP